VSQAWQQPGRHLGGQLRGEEPVDDQLREMTADGLVTAPLTSGSARAVRRFAAPERPLSFWIVAWIALAAAVLGVLVPLLSRGPAATPPTRTPRTTRR